MNKSRRNMLMTMAAAGGLIGVGGSEAVYGDLPCNSNNLITVGINGDFLALQDANNAISDASENNPYLIYILPGLHDLTAGGFALEMKPFVNISGVDRNSVQIIASETSNIKGANFSSLSNLTIRYTGSLGAIAGSNKLTDFSVANANIFVNGSGSAFASDGFIRNAVLQNLTIITEGIGIDLNHGGHLYIHDTNIHLTGNNVGNPHIGIRGNNYCRIYVFAGKIGTGYGYPNVVNEMGQDVIGILADTECSGRIQLHDVWSICRHMEAGSGDNINCVRVNGNKGWIRVHGGYFQAEGPSNRAFTNPGFGRIELYGARAKNYGVGNVYSSNQIGLSTYTTVDDNTELSTDSGGFIKCDASRGPFTLKLGGWMSETEEFIFKKIDNSSHAVTITARHAIEGQSVKLLLQQYDTLHLRFGGDQWYII